MNVTISLLVLSSLPLFAMLFYFFFGRKKNSILVAKNRLYGEFFKRTSLKEFIVILEDCDHKVMDSEIALMLQKYFELLLLRLNKDQVFNVLVSLKESKYSELLRKSLINAVVISNDSIFGIALAASINKREHKLVIEDFVERLPEKQKKLNYQVAFNFLKEYYDRKLWDYPAEHRFFTEKSMREFDEKF